MTASRRTARTRKRITRSILQIDGAQLHLALLIAALERERDVLADADVVEHRDEIGERLHRLAVERDDDVALPAAPQVERHEAGLRGGRAARDAEHHHALDAELRGDALVGGGDAEPRARRAARLDD